MKIRNYKIKRIKDSDISVYGEFESDCWYNAQHSFTAKLKNIINGYIRFETKEDIERFGMDFKGKGWYPKMEGDVLLDGVLYDTFNDGEWTYTIRVLNGKKEVV